MHTTVKGHVLLTALTLLSLSAFGQANVALYGLIDVSGNYLSFGSTSKTTGSHFYSLSSDASRLGFRGDEDLGGGQRTYFKLETGVSVDTGRQTSDTQFWNREAYLGLSDTVLGSVQLGSQFTPEISASARVDPFGRFGIGSITNLLQGMPRGWSVTFDSSVQFVTPEIAGFTARVLISAAPKVPRRRNGSAGIDYADGPIYATFTYESSYVAPASADLESVAAASRTVMAGGVYDFGSVKVHAWYQTNQLRQLSPVRAYMIGLTVPLERSDIRASYIHRADMGAGASVAALGFYCVVSKRTLLFIQLGRLENRGSAAFGLGPARVEEAGAGQLLAGREVSGLQIGIRQSF